MCTSEHWAAVLSNDQQVGTVQALQHVWWCCRKFPTRWSEILMRLVIDGCKRQEVRKSGAGQQTQPFPQQYGSLYSSNVTTSLPITAQRCLMCDNLCSDITNISRSAGKRSFITTWIPVISQSAEPYEITGGSQECEEEGNKTAQKRFITINKSFIYRVQITFLNNSFIVTFHVILHI